MCLIHSFVYKKKTKLFFVILVNYFHLWCQWTNLKLNLCVHILLSFYDSHCRQNSLSTMWSRWLWISTLQTLLLLCKLVNSMPGSTSNFKINPKPCIVNGLDGTCMFVWECIKSEGQHIGMCVDQFMFGSCCAHNLSENVILPAQQHHQHFDFRPPVKKPRPPITSNRTGWIVVNHFVFHLNPSPQRDLYCFFHFLVDRR